MPGRIRTCFLCGQSKRDPQSMYKTINISEQERQIKDEYLKRHKIEIIGSLIGKEVHRSCYRSIIQRQSLARVRSISHPRKYGRHAKRNRLQPQSNSTIMIDLDLTNVHLVPIIVVGGADQPSLNFSIDVHDLYSGIVSEQSLITSNSNSSTENIVIDPESDETSFNSKFYSSDILAPVMIDFDPDYTTSTNTGIEQQSKTLANFREASF